VEGAREPICSAKGKVTSGSSKWTKTNFTSINDYYLSIVCGSLSIIIMIKNGELWNNIMSQFLSRTYL